MSFNITPVASGYQEIHPYSAMNIDSVKINTSLIMMKEWTIHANAIFAFFISNERTNYISMQDLFSNNLVGDQLFAPNSIPAIELYVTIYDFICL